MTFSIQLGHCVAEYPNNITLRVGSSSKDYGGRIIETANIIMHSKFDKVKLINDFALIVFTEPITFDENVQPIELPYDYEEVPDGTKCKVSGWGKMENDVRPQELRAVDVYTVNFVSILFIFETIRNLNHFEEHLRAKLQHDSRQVPYCPINVVCRRTRRSKRCLQW